MTDPLHELLSSPLEDEPKRPRRERAERRAGPLTGPWLVGGIVVGALAVLLGYLVARPDDTAAAPTTTVPGTTTTAPVSLALPDGYTPIDGGRLGVRVERMLVRQDAVFVTISTVVPSGIDGSETAGFPGGRWELDFDDGTTSKSTIESRAAASPGFVTVRFDPAAGAVPDTLRLTGLGTRLTDEVVSESVEPFTLSSAEPASVDVRLTPSEFELDAGVTLVLDDLGFDSGLSRLSWRLEGGNTEARAAASPQLKLFDGDGTEIPVASPGGFGGFVFGGGVSFFEDLTLAREGEVVFSSIDQNGTFPTDTQLRAAITVPVVWQVFSPTNAEIPIDGEIVTDLTR
jgi:hypothetical protein